MRDPTDAERLAYRQSGRDAIESMCALAATFDMLGRPETLLDVGCGPGHLVRLAAAMGIHADGFDISLPRLVTEIWGSGALYRADLAKYQVSSPRSMVLCLEVAEHIALEGADNLCGLLALATGGILLFSAATPGQGGAGHLNEQEHEYWAKKLMDRGLTWKPDLSNRVGNLWSAICPTAWWYGRNMQVFTR